MLQYYALMKTKNKMKNFEVDGGRIGEEFGSTWS
jgi:hypothetical protein